MSIFKGSGVAIVTPMRDNGEVDYERFAKQLKFQIENGTDAIIVCGTTGEASTLSHEEHRFQLYGDGYLSFQRGRDSRSRWFVAGEPLLQ